MKYRYLRRFIQTNNTRKTQYFLAYPKYLIKRTFFWDGYEKLSKYDGMLMHYEKI